MSIQSRLDKLEQQQTAGLCEHAPLRVVYGDDGSGTVQDEPEPPACECGKPFWLLRVVYGQQHSEQTPATA